ncbi:unnamed protein product [Peronospora farinosa]|uniref:Mid2 domain-containing protein n=1 Tax=Peronospora farinosa TaxID=134698 RepID=A0AAV0SVU8_9STRA|nr:unnamed protein product [Peronospora farinosa]
MGSACKLLLIALAIATDAHTNALTLHSRTDDDTFIIPRESTIPTNTSPSTVIDSDVSDNTKRPASSVNTAPTTSSISDSDSTSTLDNTDQDATKSSTHDFATISSGSISDRNTNDLADETNSTPPPPAVISKSSIDGLDLVSHSNTQSSADGWTGIVEALSVVFGALACVGVVIMVVTYKIKRGVNENDSNRPSLDCEYSGDCFDDRALSVVQDKSSLVATKTPDTDLAASACIVNFVDPNSSVSTTSSLGSTRCKVRTSSAVPSSNSNSESSMQLQNTRQVEGIDVVLTFNEDWDSSRLAPEVHL